MRAIVLVSGGMDSLLTAALALEDCPGSVAFLHITYGQKTARREMESFNKIADHFSLPPERRKIIRAPFLGEMGGSSLTDERIEVSRFQKNLGEIPSSYVPFRNTLFIAMGVGWAEVLGAQFIYIGAVEEDSSGYPDCRPSYYRAYERLISEGTRRGDIRLRTPIIHMGKDEIIQRAQGLNAPLELTYSCYAANERACGVCDSCALRLRAFRRLGLEDPISYASKPV